MPRESFSDGERRLTLRVKPTGGGGFRAEIWVGWVEGGGTYTRASMVGPPQPTPWGTAGTPTASGDAARCRSGRRVRSRGPGAPLVGARRGHTMTGMTAANEGDNRGGSRIKQAGKHVAAVANLVSVAGVGIAAFGGVLAVLGLVSLGHEDGMQPAWAAIAAGVLIAGVGLCLWMLAAIGVLLLAHAERSRGDGA